ncbi:MAG TPA: amino acid permease [Polyangiaceae bacterium]|nr:amino acid permease [Polyangiaceae bacterium]
MGRDEGRGERNDEAELAALGYGQDLLRAMGGFSSFALSFSIISVLTGILTTFSDALGPGGPRGVGLGWPLVSFGTVVVALALAELSSAFPTAGALYHWSALLGGPGFGWFTAAMNLVGQFAIVAAIDYGFARELAALTGVHPLALFTVVLATHAGLNAFSTGAVAKLNDLSAVVHIAGVVALVVALLMFADKRPPSFLVTASTNRPDGDAAMGFGNALILSLFTFTGYDASAHLAEETRDPARGSPMGILSAVLVSSVFGYALVVALTLSIHDLPTAAANDHAALFVLRHALGPQGGSLGMGLALVAMWFCGLSSLTSASRTLYAFARDGGVPLSRQLATVARSTKTPVAAIFTVASISLGFVLVSSLVRERVFALAVQVATMGLYVSYGLPIALGVRARLRGRLTRRGPFHLGRLSVPIGGAAALWCVGVLVVCSLPPNLGAGGVLAGLAAALGLLWLISVRGRFQGPRVQLVDLEGRAAGAASSATTEAPGAPVDAP